MNTVHVSNVCRINPTLELLAEVTGAGIIPLSSGLLAPRQVRIDLNKIKNGVSARLVEHRGALIPVLTRSVAHSLVCQRSAEYLPQSLLVYSIDDYLKDPDVMKNFEEHRKALHSKADLVLVGVIGESRSCLSVCRNIVSGCQDPVTLKSDAEDALVASNVFLIED